MASERLYTLEQAKIIGLRELCAREGHKIERHFQATAAGVVIVDFYRCGRCDVGVEFVWPDLP